VGTPDCCCERVSQDLDLVAGSAGGVPVSSIGGSRQAGDGYRPSAVAGLDVHNKVVWVAVRLPGTRPGERAVTVRRYRRFWRELKKLAAWLTGLGVTDAALESTGV
jgi:hypothetical protein